MNVFAMEKTKIYKTRIQKAKPIELILINYEMTIDCIQIALNWLEDGNNAYTDAINQAQAFIAELYASLDLSIGLSSYLADLYLFINRKLIEGKTRTNKEDKAKALTEAKALLTELLSSWHQIAQNPQIFSELPYDKNGELLEYEDYNPNRGYEA